ncbi:protein TIFY 10A [Cinnamomum micranthum f. kanehirae]|uniref:Protein TIFY n=1 Tax=Cinnamomum micranthum f. kanehirae TaxID=337451 RepID=A0A3S3Q506_9MAGN|nr:protein TIFY 10A [Cinnamomum micranthum f. kanehirae]
MSISPSFSETGRFSGRRMPEKSNFSHTCSLLSQYLKEKGTFGDLSLGMTCNPHGKGKSEMIPPTTMNLLPKIEVSREIPERKDNGSDQTIKSMDLFPPRAGFMPSVTMEDGQKIADLSAKPKPANEPQTSQMTIFYGGKVLVFNDFPADKAKEIMLLVEKNMLPNSTHASASSNDCGNVFSGKSTFPSTAGNNPTTDRLQRPPQADVSDLPIARKASLHRFLEKRKGRISAKAPYQVNVGSSSHADDREREDSKAWLALASMTD